MGKPILQIALITIICANALLSMAQTEENNSALALEEIIVTAQKRAEDMQSIPISVTAFNGAFLRENSITHLSEIARRTPSFVWAESSGAAPYLFIRGIGTEGPSTYAGGDPSVTVMIDNVYIGRIGGSSFDLYDLERVEVLRGPQGTIFGKNAVGGLVHLISKKPSQEPTASVSATVGNFNRMDLKGLVSGPLSDSVSAKLALSALNRDGFVKNEETGNDLGDEGSTSIRGALLYQPDEQLDILISLDGSRERESGSPRDIVETGTFNGGIHAITNPDPRIVNAPKDPFFDRDMFGSSIEINYQMHAGTFTSITAYRNSDSAWEIPFFGNPVTPTTIESTSTNTEDFWQFSQELRFASTNESENLDWIVGAYYFKSDTDRNTKLTQEFASFLPFLGGIADFAQTVKTESFALFGQLTYHLTNDLDITLGARNTWESKAMVHVGSVLQGPFPPPLHPANQYDVADKENWSAFTPSIAVNYQIGDDAMIYASIARGFKSGGYQGIAPDPTAAETPFDPEFALSYEIGAKTDWLDNRLRLNVSAFFVDHEDLQISELIAGDRVVIGNAAKAEVKGAEIEFTAILVEGLQIAANYSYLDAEFVEFAEGATTDNSGNTLPFAPEHKVNLAAQYDITLANNGSLTFRVDWTRQSEIFLEASNTTEIQGAYSVWDARIAYQTADEKWELALWGKNVGDNLHRNSSVAFPPFGQELVYWSNPRTYALTLTWTM